VWTLPNILTLARICLAPVIALLPFIQGSLPKIIAFVVFLIAAFSDVIDGWYARRYQVISDLGKLLDPAADKLLLVATLVPIFWITRNPTLTADYRIPWWGSFPLWVAILLVGREILMTVFRWHAKRRGVIIAAAGPGKLKAVFQNIFIGATIAWFAWKDLIVEMRWVGWFRDFWDRFHGAVVASTLAIAVVLTLWSLGVYLYRYRALLHGNPAAEK
jgi:CDP-diacylglycerol--glycerol-3-phosphate 3-phosphatidyltransferase